MFLNTQTCYIAALHGHLKILKWARKHGCSWNSGTCTLAGANGHFEALARDIKMGF
jgi:hypothetical protein